MAVLCLVSAYILYPTTATRPTARTNRIGDNIPKVRGFGGAPAGTKAPRSNSIPGMGPPFCCGYLSLSVQRILNATQRATGNAVPVEYSAPEFPSEEVRLPFALFPRADLAVRCRISRVQ